MYCFEGMLIKFTIPLVTLAMWRKTCPQVKSSGQLTALCGKEASFAGFQVNSLQQHSVEKLQTMYCASDGWTDRWKDSQLLHYIH